MLIIKDKQARQRIIRSRTNLLVSNGFFGFLALQLRLEECVGKAAKEVPTMAVDGRTMFYNPEFVMSISERECEGVVVHEIMHCALKHFARRGNRNPMLWNIAGDFAINVDIRDSGFTLPGRPLSLKDLLDPNYKDKKGIYLYDPTLKALSTEAIYDKLVNNLPVITASCGQGADPGGCGSVLDTPGESSKKAEVEQTWETSVRIAVETAKANNAGNLPASLRKLVEQLKRPKVTWRDQTRMFIDQSMIKEVSWSRLSRRSIPAGVLMPGYQSDRLRQLVNFIDISGSVPQEMSQRMVSEVGGALDEGVADEYIVCYADTRVQHVDYFYPGDVVTVGRYSGGGTDFADSFRWLKDNAPDASAVIYLTDLQVNNFGMEPPCPVLWATYAPEYLYDKLAARVPFGKPIWVDHIYD